MANQPYANETEIKSLRGPKQQPKGTIVEISMELTTFKCADKEFLGNGGNCGSCRLSAMGETLKWEHPLGVHTQYPRGNVTTSNYSVEDKSTNIQV